MKPTPGTLDPQDVLRLHHEGLNVLQIARRLRRRNDLVVTALRDLGIRKVPDRAWLMEHYVEGRESVDDIAAFWGVKEAAIRRHLRNYDIPIRYRSHGSDRNPLISDADWLFARYITDRLSQQQIADLARCNVSGVSYALHRFGIARGRTTGYRKFESTRKQFTGRVRAAVLSRDGYRCRWQGCDATERLEINHIVPLSENGTTVAENGITLCCHHHRGIRGRELEFVALFQTLVSLGPLT
jgi:HNH endonuclease